MKYCFLLLINLIFINLKLCGQDISFINVNIDNINKEIETIDFQIKSLTVKKDSLVFLMTSYQSQKNKIEHENELTDGIDAKVNFMGASLREEPKTTSKSIMKISSGTIITVYPFYQDPYFKVTYNDLIGYVSFGSLEMNNKLEEIKIRALMEENPKLASLTRKFGSTNAKKILKGLYWIGMTKDMARASLGSPDHDNRSVGTWGVHNQWIYKNINLYFEEGILTSWQD